MGGEVTVGSVVVLEDDDEDTNAYAEESEHDTHNRMQQMPTI
jgi:hypothetical protein